MDLKLNTSFFYTTLIFRSYNFNSNVILKYDISKNGLYLYVFPLYSVASSCRMSIAVINMIICRIYILRHLTVDIQTQSSIKLHDCSSGHRFFVTMCKLLLFVYSVQLSWMSFNVIQQTRGVGQALAQC